MSLTIISELSRKYGSNPAYVLAGGGNTSYKDEQYLYVKPSGVALASITENDFVKMDRARLRSCFELGEFASKDEREAAVKKLVLTHLPQFGDLEQLRKEAEDAAQGVVTELATPHKTWDFNTF